VDDADEAGINHEMDELMGVSSSYSPSPKSISWIPSKMSWFKNTNS
jgi:hypothetical protein